MSGFKVLVADDSQVYRTLVERTLSREAFSVMVAKSGKEAIDKIAGEQVNLVITDWEMPGYTGIELCQHIRGTTGADYTYVIILTSNAEKTNLVKGLAAGADDYLTKPFDPDELLARVRVGCRVLDMNRQIEAQNRLLKELALTDSLTRLPNRRAVEEWSERQLSGATRHGFAFWVVLMDLDHFKRVNDSYGHEAGDVVLKKFGEILKANTRSSDMAARIGGEEFLSVLTHTGEDGAVRLAEHIRGQLAEARFQFGETPLIVTASFGLAGLHFGKQPKFSELLSQADSALYRAKHLGRNRIQIGSGAAS